MSTILVLEDDPANLQVFAALLWSKRHYVLEASTAREALDAVRRNGRPDLLVSDVTLKGDEMSGPEVATALLDRYVSVPIIFVTGTPPDLWDEIDRRRLNGLRSRSAVAVLEKPLMPPAFESAVADLLHEATGGRRFPAATSAPKIAARPSSGSARSVPQTYQGS